MDNDCLLCGRVGRSGGDNNMEIESEDLMDSVQGVSGVLGLPFLSPEEFVGLFLVVMGASRWVIQPIKLWLETKWGAQEGLAAGLALVLTCIILPLMLWLFKTNLDGATLIALVSGGVGAQYGTHVLANKATGTTNQKTKIEAGIVTTEP